MFMRHVSVGLCLGTAVLIVGLATPVRAQNAAPPSSAGATEEKKRDDREHSGQEVPTVKETVDVVGKAPGETLSMEVPAQTASRLGLPVREIPASVTIVDQATIEQRGAADTQAILSSVPGMTAAAPPGGAGSVWYRGFGSTQITQLFNGITVQYDAIAGRPVDSWIYREVEVIGGPSTFLFGAGAVGGSINYITKLPAASGNSFDARVGYGSYNTSELSLGLNRRLGGTGVRNTVRADLSRTYSNGAIDGNQRGAVSTAVSLLSEFGSKFTHTAAFEFQNEQVDQPYWGTPILNPTTGVVGIDDATRFKNYNSRDGIYEQTIWWGRSVTEFRPSARMSVRNTVYHYDALRDYRNVEEYRYTPDNTAVVRSAPLLQRHDQVLTGDRVEAQFHTSAGLASDWSAGFDVSANTQTRFPRSLTLNVSTVSPLNFTTEAFFDVPGMVPGFSPDRTNDVGTLAVFAENRTKLTSALSLVTGVRRDRIQLDVTNFRAVSATSPAFFSNTYHPITGRAALSYEIAPKANVYAQFSTAADPPAGILTTASFAQVRNFDLTTGRQFEVGTKLELPDGRGAVTAAVYGIVRKNLAITDPTNPSTTIPVGQQSSKGFELSSSVRASSALLVQGNYGYTAAQYDDFLESVGGVAVSRAGNRPTGVPVHVANVWLTYALAPKWSASFDTRTVSARYANTANTISAPGYAVLGASVSRGLGKNASVVARVRNLTDKVYAAAITSTPMFFLGAPRTLEVNIRLAY
ncbi:MAG: TonB-dependent receptor [Vicinamibacterales bacterium]